MPIIAKQGVNVFSGRERPVSQGPERGAASYQPFSSAHEPPDEKAPPRVVNLYDTFVGAREKYVFKKQHQKFNINSIFFSSVKAMQKKFVALNSWLCQILIND